MKIKQISRRKFVSGITAVAGATLLVACVPVSPTPQQGKVTTTEPTSPEKSVQSATAGKILKVCIVYDSVYGNTAKIAEAMIEGIGGNQSQLIKAQEASKDDLTNHQTYCSLVHPPRQAPISNRSRNSWEAFPLAHYKM